MTSAFGWLDNDDAQREEMMEVVKLFQDQSSVDELGIGSVRDAFSDSFFPGTSVLHTRVRYLLFIPWLLREMARKGWSLERSRKELRSSEVRLIRSLLAGGETRGVTGNRAQERLKTMPSALYWPALGRLRLRRWDVSIDGYFRATSQGAKRVAEVGEDDEGSRHDLGLDPSIPPAPKGWLEETTFTLTPDEADFLKGVFARMPRTSLISWLGANATTVAADQIWEHPQLADFPAEHQMRIDHARRFHHVSHGAALLYNLMLAELSGSVDLTDHYDAAIQDWEAELDQSAALQGWSIPEFWTTVHTLNPRLKPTTEHFLTRWFKLVESGDHTSQEARSLVQNREVRLKGNRSRLVNAAAREQWNGESGVGRLSYRWEIASSFLGDVQEGLA